MSERIAESVVEVLREVLGPQQGLSLHEPEFAGNEWDYVKECLDTGWVSSVGKFVDLFEERLAQACGTSRAVVVANGTAALQVSLLLTGVKQGDEVIVPALSFVATANAVVHAGGVPHFVDSRGDNLGMDPEALDAYLSEITRPSESGAVNRATGRRIAAIVPMHAFGFPASIEELIQVGNKYGIAVIEDAAESLGSTLRGRHLGSFGVVGALSFNGNKIVTTGGGGAIVTNDDKLATRAKQLTTTFKRPHRWEFFHEEVAFNYRMPNLNAALGCAQLERLPDFLLRKRNLAHRYLDAFDRVGTVEFVRETEGVQSNYWLNTIKLPEASMQLRDEVLEKASAAGYGCRPVWTLLHKLPMYREAPRAPLPIAEKLEASLINLPSSARLGGDR
jgi:perosamine synthetase